MAKIVCDNCLKKHSEESLKRICSNCFLCTGCEIYRCPKCGEEIVVTPMPIAEYGNRPATNQDPESAD